MFQGLISDAKAASGLLIDKYFARASVVVPFVVALGFATAAITLMLVNRFGYIAAFWIIAGGFTLIGLVATRVVSRQGEQGGYRREAGRGPRYRRDHPSCGAGCRSGADDSRRWAPVNPAPTRNARGGSQDGRPQYAAGRFSSRCSLSVLAERVRKRCRRA